MVTWATISVAKNNKSSPKGINKFVPYSLAIGKGSIFLALTVKNALYIAPPSLNNHDGLSLFTMVLNEASEPRTGKCCNEALYPSSVAQCSI